MGNMIAISVILFFVFCVVHYQYKKKGKKGCGTGCNHCPFHNDCHSNEKKS